jgi:Flp pilus assembly protein TadD
MLSIGFIFVGAMLSHRAAKYFNNRGQDRFQKGDIKAALGDYKWATRLSPGYAAAHYNLADTYEEIPDYDKAVNEYQRAIDADPTFYPAYNNLSRLYILRRKDCGAALRLLDRALELHPEESSVRYTLHKNYGWANLCLGQFQEAQNHFWFALKIDERGGAVYCLMGILTEEVSKTVEAALPAWQSCLALSNQVDVEPEWRNQAQDRLTQAHQRAQFSPSMEDLYWRRMRNEQRIGGPE